MRWAVVVGLVGACHGGSSVTGDAAGSAVDARSSDAAPDVLDAATRGPITVTVYGDGVDANRGVPVGGVNVYFVEPDQTVTDIVTGIDGVATTLAANDTTVWVVHHEGSSYFIETFEGARIGDSITAGDPTPMGPDTIAGQVYVAFPTFGDASTYQLRISCTTPTNTSAPVGVSFLPCAQELAANAIVTASDSAGHLGYTTASAIDLTAHTSSGTAISLPAFQAGSTIGVSFTNLPSTLGESTTDLYVRYRRGTDPLPMQEITLSGGTLTDTMMLSGAIAPVGDQTQLIGQVHVGGSAYTYDLNAAASSQVASISIDASQMVHPGSVLQVDIASSSLTWTSEAFGVDPTVVSASLSWNVGSSVAWHLVAPYAGSPTLALPAAPPALASVIPAPADAGFKQLDLTSYAGKTYHDALVGQTSGATSWHLGVQ